LTAPHPALVGVVFIIRQGVIYDLSYYRDESARRVSLPYIGRNRLHNLGECFEPLIVALGWVFESLSESATSDAGQLFG
jgi:hypothetical protein